MKCHSFILVCFFCHFFNLLWAEDVLTEKTKKEKEANEEFFRKQAEEYRISEKYRAGNFLIYDCVDQHYVCVDEYSFLTCGEKREKDKSEKKSDFRCTPFKKFKTKEECLKKNDEMIVRKSSASFCRKAQE